MKTIGVIIGSDDEPISKKYYNKNKSSLKILEEYDIYSDYIPYDYAMFAEIKKQGELKGFTVIPLFGRELTLKDCNQCDCIFCIYEGVYSFMHGGIEKYKKYMDILKKTKATVFPSQKMQQFIINKHKYMKYLDTKGYNIAQTKFIDLSRSTTKSIMDFISKNNLTDIIIKPELGAFKDGFKIIKNPTTKKVDSYLSKLKKKGYKRLLLQPYIQEFNKFGEIKTYWINGKNIFSYNQKWKDGEGVFQTQDKIEPELLKECLNTAKKLLKDIFQDHEPLIQCRVDFACCMNNDKRCREFFINEIEICPTTGEQESNGKAYSLLAKQVIEYCLK
tara:strand:+ start:133 stop:1128 length:996 start_codon:yes stop_codon:yes gene_type:complete